MNRTYTPELKPDVLDRLAAYAASFRDDFNRPRQAAWCGVYLRGLITDGDRKSVEPMAARVAPGDLQQRHHFVSTSPWAAAPWRRSWCGPPSARWAGRTRCWSWTTPRS